MRSLKRLNTEARKDARPSKDGLPTETNTFKRDLQLLERLILKKLDEFPVSSGNLLATLFDDHYPLIERLTPHWQRREVMRAIRSVRQELGRQDSADQFLLPGFEDLPRRIRVGSKRQHVASAKYPQAVQCLEALRQQQKKDDGRIAQMEALIVLMEKYVQTEPEITVREVCEREQA